MKSGDGIIPWTRLIAYRPSGLSAGYTVSTTDATIQAVDRLVGRKGGDRPVPVHLPPVLVDVLGVFQRSGRAVVTAILIPLPARVLYPIPVSEIVMDPLSIQPQELGQPLVKGVNEVCTLAEDAGDIERHSSEGTPQAELDFFLLLTGTLHRVEA